MATTRIPNSRIRTLVPSILLFCAVGFCSACTKPLPNGWTPFQLAFFNPAQVFGEETDVRGVRVSAIYGNNAEITGIDIGGIGLSDSMTGLQVNMAYSEAANLDGVQISSINKIDERVRGVQLGGVISHADEVIGLQIAPVHNLAETVKGVQIGGMINETEELTGVQIGIVNFNWSRPFPFQCLPFISIGFGGSGAEEEDSED
jgi:hypothetical protein